jgi:hypothetical protein
VTVVGPLNGIQGVDALAFGPNGTLYGGGWNGVTGRLITINPGNAALLTNIPMFGTGNSATPGLAFDPSGQLFGSRGNAFGRLEDLVRINVNTGVQTPVGTRTNIISDIRFDSDGTLFGGSPNGDLFRIDPLTGNKTLLFNTGIRIAGLTLAPTVVPEPGTFTLLGILSLFGYARWRWVAR